MGRGFPDVAICSRVIKEWSEDWCLGFKSGSISADLGEGAGVATIKASGHRADVIHVGDVVAVEIALVVIIGEGEKFARVFVVDCLAKSGVDLGPPSFVVIESGGDCGDEKFVGEYAAFFTS